MYITNPDKLVGYKIYWCNGVMGEWLMEERKIPILCRKGRMMGFAITENLKKALKEIPFWLKLTKIF